MLATYAARAVAHLARGNLDKARDDFSRARKLDPDRLDPVMTRSLPDLTFIGIERNWSIPKGPALFSKGLY